MRAEDAFPAAPRRVECCDRWPDCNHPDQYEDQGTPPTSPTLDQETSMPIVKYRKKPVIVATVEWTGDNEAELTAFTRNQFQALDPEDRTEDPEMTGSVFDELHRTWVGVYTGQHIVRGVKGEFYPIAADVLAETYEPVTEDVAS